MSNLLNSVKAVMSDNVVDKLASLVGSNSAVTKTALTSMLPSLMKGIISKGSSQTGASSLLSMIKDHDLGSGTLSNLSSSLGGGDSSKSFMDKGAKLNEAIFGSDLSKVTTPQGMDAGASSKLMNLATPILMGSIGKVVKTDNLDAKGLQSYLGSQKMKVVDHASARQTATSATTATSDRVQKSGGSIMRWLIPLFFLLAAGWFFTQYLGDKKAADTQAEATTATEQKMRNNVSTSTATHTHSDGTVHKGAAHEGSHKTGTVAGAAKDAANSAAGAVAGAAGTVAGAAGAVAGGAAGLTVDADGNLLKDGKLFLKAGEFSVKDGEYFDKDGKSLGLLQKVGKAIGDAGKAVGGAVGDAGKAVGGAVAGAAGKTADAFKDVFGGMFKKKASGTAVAAYSLSDIVFDSESHKITTFSKNEVMGLAAALKATPDAKIKVQVSSSDGGDKKVTKQRAQVVHDMLVTLGVADKQISAEGMGAGDGKVNIVIE